MMGTAVFWRPLPSSSSRGSGPPISRAGGRSAPAEHWLSSSRPYRLLQLRLQCGRQGRGVAAAGANNGLPNTTSAAAAQPKEMPPGPTPLPVLGNLIDVGLGKVAQLGPQPHVRMKELADVYGDVMSLSMGGGAPWVVISSPERVWEAFIKRGRDFSGRPMVPSMSVSSGGGQGFASNKMTPELQALRRTAFSELFSPPSVARGHRLFLKEAEALADHLSTANATPFGYHNTIRPAVRQAATNMVLSYGLSLRAPYSTESVRANGSQVTTSRQAVELSETVGQLWECLTDTSTTFLDLVAPAGSAVVMPSAAYGRLPSLVDRRNGLLLEIVRGRRRQHQQFQSSSAPTGDLLDSMIGLGMDDTCILYILVDLFVAGVNTVSSTTEWALLLTAQDQSCQDAMRHDAGRANYENLCCAGAAPWVDACLQETLRHKQPLLLPRQAVCDSELGGYPIKEGTIVYANNYALTHDERLWHRADEFRPRRFFEEEAGLLPRAQMDSMAANGSAPLVSTKYKLIPFSVGQRACPGELLAQAELRALLSVLSRRLSWEPLQPWGGVDLRENYSLTLQPLATQTLRFKRFLP